MKWIVVLAIAAAGYWYWSGPFQESRLLSPQEQLENNAKLMQRCVDKEKSMAGSAGVGGIGGIIDGAESLCAEQLGLTSRDGDWYSAE